jgi:beta-phosphoglucomutase
MKLLQKIIKNSDAVFFDLDGTLVFTESLHQNSYKEACKKLGLSFSDLKFPYSSEIYDLKKEIYFDKLKEKKYEINREIYSVYLEVFNKNKKVAIVTNTLRQNVDIIIETFDRKPDLVVAGSDFPQKIKPEPDMYLYALNHFSLDAQDCVVLEDSVTGKTAALAAGIKVFDIKEGVLYEPL